MEEMGGFDDIRGCVRISIVEEDCRKIGDRTEFVDFKLSKEFITNHHPPNSNISILFKTFSSYCFLF